MEFPWLAFWATVLWKIVEGWVSYDEDTFSLRQLWARGFYIEYHGLRRWQHLPMSFLNNWTASWGDPLILPLFNALISPYLWPMTGWWWKYPVYFFIGSAASIIAHRIWWGHNEHLGHIFKSWSAPSDKDFWIDLTKAGLAHFWFMAVQVAVALAYIVTPMPKEVVFWASGLLVIFFVIQNVQAVMIQRSEHYKACTVAAMEIIAVGVIALIKL